MTHYIGILALLLTSVMIGNRLAASVNSRQSQLKLSQKLICELEGRFRFMSDSVQSALRYIEASNSYKDLHLFDRFFENLEHMDQPEALDNAILTAPNYLKKEDRELLRSFARALGQTDRQGQVDNCKLHAALLEEIIKREAEPAEKKSRLYRTLGVLAGVLIAIILL